ncbi:hypothetical protein [Ramlibacter rhizophilus]|uniref:hypothetical protein n=1 Tax=Ramlibacter rhizophilus TaxID=1781167 RepID=UPI00143230F7|nr:hypothetical protein [Ramlibacter rhizophilus]
MTDFLANAASTPGLTLPGIRIGSDDDLRRMLELMRASPAVEKAIAEHIAKTGTAAAAQRP